MRHSEHPVRRAFLDAMAHSPLADAAETASALFVGYSGGADSAALLAMMQAYCAERSLPCTAVHVHHGIRGAEADRDAQLCRQFCEMRGIPLILRYADVPTYAAEHRMGIEEAARQVRYGIFDAILADHPGALIATAHSADDQLETVLHRMLRGCGIDGLCGIPPIRGSVIRPLLGVSADDIRAFCRDEQIPFAVDSTNADTAYTRNYIRAEIVPRLRQITPSPEAAVSRMSTLLAPDAAFLHEYTTGALGEYANTSAAPLSILSRMPDAILARAVALLYESAAGGDRDLSAVHIRDAMALIRRGTPGRRIPLPGGYAGRIFDDVFSVVREENLHALPDKDFLVVLQNGDNFFPTYGFCLRIGGEIPEEITDGKNVYKLAMWNSFPFDTIQGEIYLRFRRPGDTVLSGGMTRSVKKLLCAARIPPEARARLPVLSDERGIFWIPGVAARDAADHSGAWTVSYFTI